jgi:large subunit ribosomal protein L18
MALNKAEKRKRRKLRSLRKLRNNIERPRITVFKSNKYISAQLIDDREGKTLVCASSIEKDLRETYKGKKNITVAREVGKRLAERAIEKKIENVSFDRSGYKFHGRIKALADAAREKGLKF